MEPTKRNTITTVGQVYDPMGLTAPVTIRMILLHDLYCARLSCDQPLEGEFLAQGVNLLRVYRGAIMSTS